MPDRDPATFYYAIYTRLPTFGQIVCIFKPPGIQILGFRQPPRFHERRVIYAVVVHHHPRRSVESFYQQSAGIVDGIIDRADDLATPSPTQPSGGCIEQGVSCLFIIHAFKHAEATGISSILFVEARIVAHQCAAYRLPIAHGDELRGRAMQIERMLSGIEKFLDII